MLFEIHCFVLRYCAAGCAVNNGGCEHRCVRGSPDRCICNAGFRLSANERDCVGKHYVGFTYCLGSVIWQCCREIAYFNVIVGNYSRVFRNININSSVLSQLSPTTTIVAA